MKSFNLVYLIFASFGLFATEAMTQNLFIRNQFTADPTARVFNG